MMKKLLFSVAVLALCACSNDEVVSDSNSVVEPKEISFSPLAKPNTRAAIDGTTFPEISMMVTAYDAENPGVFFDATPFSKGSSTTWAGTPSKYWPLAPATINFLAIANANADNATGVTWGTNKADQVTIVMSDNSTAQRDLMYACGTGSVTQQPSNALEFPTNVPMIFKHAQAWIKFTVKANSATEVSKLTVNSITLNSVSCDGTFTVTHANYDKTKALRDAATPPTNLNGTVSGDWSDYSTNAGNKAAVKAGNYSALSTSEQAFGDLMVVPDQGMASFTINYTVDGNTYNYTYTPASTSLAQATKYVYNISFGLHEILIAPQVADWTDGRTTAVQPQ